MKDQAEPKERDKGNHASGSGVGEREAERSQVAALRIIKGTDAAEQEETAGEVGAKGVGVLLRVDEAGSVKGAGRVEVKREEREDEFGECVWGLEPGNFALPVAAAGADRVGVNEEPLDVPGTDFEDKGSEVVIVEDGEGNSNEGRVGREQVSEGT